MRISELFEGDVVDMVDHFSQKRQDWKQWQNSWHHPVVGTPINYAAVGTDMLRKLDTPRKVEELIDVQGLAMHGLWEIVTDRGENWHVYYNQEVGWYRDFPEHHVT